MSSAVPCGDHGARKGTSKKRRRGVSRTERSVTEGLTPKNATSPSTEPDQYTGGGRSVVTHFLADHLLLARRRRASIGRHDRQE